MTSIIAMILAAIPQALLAIAAKLFTETFFQKVLEKILISALDYAVKLTTNTIDDELVEEIKTRLAATPPSK